MSPVEVYVRALLNWEQVERHTPLGEQAERWAELSEAYDRLSEEEQEEAAKLYQKRRRVST